MTTPKTQDNAGAEAAAFEGHTPGDWQLKNGYIAGKGENNATIAQMLYDPNGANGKLLAAAPSLLRERDNLRAKLAASEASRAELVGALEGLANRVYGHGHGDPWALLGDVRAALADTQEGGAK